MTEQTAQQLIAELRANTEAQNRNERAAQRLAEALVSIEQDIDTVAESIEGLGEEIARQNDNSQEP